MDTGQNEYLTWCNLMLKLIKRYLPDTLIEVTINPTTNLMEILFIETRANISLLPGVKWINVKRYIDIKLNDNRDTNCLICDGTFIDNKRVSCSKCHIYICGRCYINIFRTNRVFSQPYYLLLTCFSFFFS